MVGMLSVHSRFEFGIISLVSVTIPMLVFGLESASYRLSIDLNNIRCVPYINGVLLSYQRNEFC